MASPETPGDECRELRSGAAGVSCSGTPTKLGPSGANVDSQLQDAVHLKTEGNKFYKEKHLRSAIGRYHRSLLILRSLDSDVTAAVKGFGPEAPVLIAGQEELLRNTQIDCYNNLAACLLQRECVDYTRVQEYSLRVLQLRPDDIKALYRAGLATLELGDAQSAKQYLTQASKGQPNDTNVRRHLQRAEERRNTEYQKEKALYRGMFSSS
ncbi:tetratricopeptide repeat protein 9C [Oncorhynchus mykiss]|nr:tetratricopeptide repeat protein 9C [Oncorhynchus mykiss]XP_021417300.2 tetratricopeptide repeat protein 9C [Oncorhynchus mykiss]